jgi:hypothetical protein
MRINYKNKNCITKDFKMNLGFIKFKKPVAFLIFSCFLGMSTQTIFGYNQTNIVTQQNQLLKEPPKLTITEINISDPKDIYLKTTQRTILKIIIDTFFTYLKEAEKKNAKEKGEKDKYPITPLDYYELGKIGSDFVIDELIPNPNAKTSPKVIELLLPPLVAILATSLALDEKNHMETIAKLIQKLAYKLIMVRFFQNPGENTHTLCNALAIFVSFLNYSPKDPWRFLKLYTGLELITLDQLRLLINSINLGKSLNQKQRKKAIGKAAQVFAKPVVQAMIFGAKNYLIDEKL